MKLIRSINSCFLSKKGCVLTIGKFDAVHIGHQKILRQLVAVGKRLDLPTVVMTFSPNPEEYFRKDEATPRLTSISSQYFALRDHRIDVMLALPFNKALAQTSAEAFVQDYLIDGLNAKYISIGDDFKFGKNRRGDYQMLEQAGDDNGFEVGRFQTVKLGNNRVSSTRVRESLEAGNFDEIDSLLGGKFTMVGRVVHGDKRGREWGFPTANIAIKRKAPLTGIYAVTVGGLNNSNGPCEVKGVANLGTRPTVDGVKTLLEVHLFNFNESIYGKRICVEFVKKIRDEQKFGSFDELKSQILKDCESAKAILNAKR